MKKMMFIATLAVFIAGSLFGGTITVTQPAGGNMAMGAACPIAWTASGVTSNVRINLIAPGGAMVGMLIGNLIPGSSPYTWTVGAPAVAGQQYRIRVVAQDGSGMGESAVFTVTSGGGDPGTPGSIADVQLSGTSPHRIGDSRTISWAAPGVSTTLKLQLIRSSGSIVGAIANSLPAGTTSHNWPAGHYIGGTAEPGEKFRIRVSTTDNSLTAESQTFALSNSLQQNISMDIILPKSGQVFNVGDPLPIEWISSGLIGNTLKVYLCKGVNGVQYVSTIANNWPNTPHLQKSWKIPLNLATGNYKIIVLDITGAIYHGNVFIVKPPITIQTIQANTNHLYPLSINKVTKITNGKKPYILSFYPDKLAKRIPSIPGAEDSFLVILNFYWKDDDGDLLNGKWHFSYKSDKFGYSGNQSGRIGEKNPARYTGTKGSVIGFEAISINGKVTDQVKIWFVLEDSRGNFSDKMTGLVTLSQ